MEQLGLFFVVASINVRFRKPANYDDVLDLTTRIRRQTPAKIEHQYELKRGDLVLTEADSVIACVDTKGELVRIPENLFELTKE